MTLDERERQIIEAFRAWLTSTVESRLSLDAGRRFDRRDQWMLVTRWEAQRRIWYEVVIQPTLPALRAGLVTDDPLRSRDFEQMIQQVGLTLQEFVASGLEAAGLAWPTPPVEHYCERGELFHFATPLDLDAIEQLADETTRWNVYKILDGYHRAFSGKATG